MIVPIATAKFIHCPLIQIGSALEIAEEQRRAYPEMYKTAAAKSVNPARFERMPRASRTTAWILDCE
jgi:hypothetical protein